MTTRLKVHSALYKVEGSKLVTYIVSKLDKQGVPIKVRRGLVSYHFDACTMFNDPVLALLNALTNIANHIDDLHVRRERLILLLKEVNRHHD